jgi:hypothetical protein
MSLTLDSPTYDPRIIKVDGRGLTSASIMGLTPAKFEAFANDEVELAKVIANSAEASILGIEENPFATILKTSIVNIKPALTVQNVSEQSIILPYIQRKQRSVINANYWTISAGALDPNANGNGGDDSLSATAWRLVVGQASATPWDSPLESLERYFLPGMTVVVLAWDNTSDRNAVTRQYTILQSANASATTAYVTVEQLMGPTGSLNETRVNPTSGMVTLSANSVSDWEDWCQNQPADLSWHLLTNWIQTTRESRTYDEEYKKTLDAILAGKVNLLAKLNNMPVAEQNRIASVQSERAWLHSVFYGQHASPNQTVENYRSLEAVKDPEDASLTMEFKANALGIFTILSERGRVADLQGERLDLDWLFEQIDVLARYRGGSGGAPGSVEVVDCVTDRNTADRIYIAMAAWYKSKYSTDVIRYAKIGEKIKFENTVLFNYNLYDIPSIGLQLAVYHNPFFKDNMYAFPGGTPVANATTTVDFKARARTLWFVNWGDVKVGIAGMKQVMRKSPNPEVDALYKCRMNANIRETQLRSKKWTVMVDLPQTHLIVHNFSDEAPVVT